MSHVNPNGCHICGLDERPHMQRWSNPAGWHKWTPPTDAQIKQRMQDRRLARLTAPPAQYHATTAWDPAPDGESADPYCADCKTPVCHRWARIQTHLDQIRYGIRHRTKHPLNPVAAGWGDDNPNWPF